MLRVSLLLANAFSRQMRSDLITLKQLLEK
jgi:hypothetical protein